MNPLKAAKLYTDLRNWWTCVERLPPSKPSATRTIEKQVGSISQRATIISVYLLGQWVDTEKYFKAERQQQPHHRDALILTRTAPKRGAGSLPKTIGALLDSSPTHSAFADIWEALEIMQVELDTLNSTPRSVLDFVR